jgi:hypothetical protein
VDAAFEIDKEHGTFICPILTSMHTYQMEFDLQSVSIVVLLHDHIYLLYHHLTFVCILYWVKIWFCTLWLCLVSLLSTMFVLWSNHLYLLWLMAFFQFF